MIVADASLLANLLIPWLDNASAEAVLQRDPVWHAPALWSSEFRHTLLKYIRAKDLAQVAANDLMMKAQTSMETASIEMASPDVIATAVTLEISTYDAEYVVLARKLGLALVTYDKRLAKAASDIAFLPTDFLSRS